MNNKETKEQRGQKAGTGATPATTSNNQHPTSNEDGGEAGTHLTHAMMSSTTGSVTLSLRRRASPMSFRSVPEGQHRICFGSSVLEALAPPRGLLYIPACLCPLIITRTRPCATTPRASRPNWRPRPSGSASRKSASPTTAPCRATISMTGAWQAADLDQYVARVEQARRDHPNLVIKLALEVDYLPGQEDWIRDLAARHPWDYFIGSVHYISDSWAIDNPAEIARWKDREPLEVWTAYFERLTLAAESGLFDIIGHADLCKKFSFYPRGDCTPALHPFPASRQTARPGRRTQHRRSAQGVPGDLSQPAHRPPRRAARRAHRVWFRRPCPERGRPELRRGRPTRPQRRLHPLLPLHETPARGHQTVAPYS